MAGATGGFRCCLQNYDSQKPRCAASEPRQHLPSPGTFMLNSKVPQRPQDLLLHTGVLQPFKITLFRERKEQEALGRDMTWSCRRWGRAICVWVWDYVEQRSCLLKWRLMIWSNGKEQQQRRALRQAVTGSLDFVSDFSHYLIKWNQPTSSTVLPAYTQKGLRLDSSGITSGCAALVLSSPVLSDL